MEEYVELTVSILKETDLAFLIVHGDNKQWLPKSRTEVLEYIDGNNLVLISIPEWLAVLKDLV